MKRSVADAFQKLGYIRLPVDPSELMDAHGIQLLPYQTVYNAAASLEDLATLCRCPNGLSFTLTENGRNLRFVACNLQENPGRVRFTKLHETGHLLLEHFQDSELAETGANLWAKYAIAPPVLVKELGLTTAEEVAQHFGTSMECAANALKQHSNWLRHRRDDREIDDSILELYKRGLLLEQREEEPVDLMQIMQ